MHQKNPKACPGKLFGDQVVEGKAPDPGALKQVGGEQKRVLEGSGRKT